MCYVNAQQKKNLQVSKKLKGESKSQKKTTHWETIEIIK